MDAELVNILVGLVVVFGPWLALVVVWAKRRHDAKENENRWSQLTKSVYDLECRTGD